MRSPIRFVTKRVITKSDDCGSETDLFITIMITDQNGPHEVLTPINHKNYNFREKKNSQVMKEGKICIKRLTKKALVIETKVVIG